jgi:hypothetical protein
MKDEIEPMSQQAAEQEFSTTLETHCGGAVNRRSSRGLNVLALLAPLAVNPTQKQPEFDERSQFSRGGQISIAPDAS